MQAAPKERPILFSAPMVRALLDGSKTQTRRVCKPMQQWVEQECREVRMVDGAPHHFLKGASAPLEKLRSPYGQTGDRLWVRESWHQRGSWQAPGWPEAEAEDYYWGGTRQVVYAADADSPGDGWRSRPSIHMPRWASRILLEIVSVRVERLQDISEADAIAEGIRRVGPGWERWHPDPEDTEHTGSTQKPRLSYLGLWESINGAGSWDANPWVWVVEFKRVPVEQR